MAFRGGPDRVFAGATLDEVALRPALRLVNAADAYGVKSESGVVLSTRLTQSEQALMVGTARQTMNRILRALQEQGLVTIRYGVIVITDMPRLRSVAQHGSQLRGFAA